MVVTKNADRLIFDDVVIKGGQDTLYADSGICYFNGCEIWGSVDFIYGEALAVFEACDIVQIRESGGPVCAPKTPSDAPYGEVFLNCSFPRATTAAGYPYTVETGSSTFMRPWGEDGLTQIINCEVGSHFSTKAWGEWSGRETTCRAREYGTTLIGGGTVTVAQRQAAGAYWLNTIDPDYVDDPSLDPTDTLLYGTSGRANRVSVDVNPANYTLEAIFGDTYYNLGGWLPVLLETAEPPVITAQPIGRAVALGANVSLSVEASTFTGVTNYQWQVDSNSITAGNVSGSDASVLTITGFDAANAGYYRCVVSDGSSFTNSADALLTMAAAPSMAFDGIISNAFSMEFPTEIGPTYLVQTNTDLLSTNWQSALSIVGDGEVWSVLSGNTNTAQLFIRVLVQ